MALDGYNRREFWEAYARFFFVPNQDLPGLVGMARCVHETVAHHTSGRPLNVLCLGIGITCFEYPVLSALQEVSGSRINVFGLDVANKPMRVTDALLRDLGRKFTTSWEFADFVNATWSASTSPNLSPRLKCIDLDGRRGGPQVDYPWQADYPSDWHNQINDIVPSGGFDIITSAFCLHHMHWWRPTLCNALQLLRQGGILLVSQVDGDVNYFDWNQPANWLLERRERRVQNDENLVLEMLTAFWSHRALKEEWLVRAHAGATRPYAQLDLIERLPLRPLGTAKRFAYFTENPMRPQDVLAIMDTRGLSPFRRAQNVLRQHPDFGSEEYDRHIESIRERFAQMHVSITRNRIRWHGYQSPGNPKLNSSALVRKFTTRLRPPRDLPRSHGTKALLADYELLEASVVSHETFTNVNVNTHDFNLFLKQLILSGTLSNLTSMGVMGQRLVRQEAFSSAVCFMNPLRSLDYSTSSDGVPELMIYMCLRQAHLSSFSNSNVLLKQVLPRFKVPVVFSYLRESAGKDELPSITLEFERYRSFVEMRFHIRLARGFTEGITEMSEFRQIRSLITDVIGQDVRRDMNDHLEGVTSHPSFIFQVPVLAPDSRARFKTLSTEIAMTFRQQFGLEKAHIALMGSLRSCAHPFADEKYLIESFSVEMVETLYWLCLIPNWNEVVIFPASYAEPKGKGVVADDSMILFYSREIDQSSLRHEFRKVSLMFDQLNMRRLATSGEATGLNDQLNAFSHELSKQTTVLFSNRLRKMSDIFEVNDLSRTNDLTDWNDWPAAAGKVSVAPSEQNQVAQWLVCPAPTLFFPIMDYLTLWAGSHGALGQIAPSLATVKGLIEAAVEVARGGWVAIVMKDFSPKSMEGVKEAELEIEKAKQALPSVKITLAGNPGISSGTTRRDSNEERVLNLVFRAIVAAVSNAFQHTHSSTGTIEIGAMLQSDGVVFSVRNELVPNGDVTLNLGGTAAVIRNCLLLIDKDTTDPYCGKDPDNPAFWLTRFLLPARARYRDSEVQWLDEPIAQYTP